jgi:alkylglycerol monooxygenase
MEIEIIIFAIPVFVLLIAIEFLLSRKEGRDNYRLNDSINSLSLGCLSQAVSVCTLFFQIGIYELIYDHTFFGEHLNFWSSWYGWTLSLLMYDFLAYWAHRVSHESGVFWASHSVHHQSQCFNLTTALRQESFYPVTTCIFFTPLAFLGLPPTQYGLVGILILMYQFWVHTEHIGKLGWLDKVFTTPSNHRVHHAMNDAYIDKNYGDFLIVWDRMFGTYQQENELCVYGTKTPLNSWNPIWANFCVLSDLVKKSKKQTTFISRFLVFFKSPAWRETESTDVAGYGIYNPQISKARKLLAITIFLLGFVSLLAFLYVSDSLTYIESVIGCILISLQLWLVGNLLDTHLQKKLQVLA